jgi:20S proteasome subunit alpha 6
MFRNQYDTSVTTWSPDGRLHQVEYAMEAVKQGSACIGLRSDKFAVLSVLKRSQSELASYQDKLFKIDDHMGIGVAGLMADARSLSKYMRTECMNHKYVFESPMQTGRLVNKVADKHYYKERNRPYGVGLLVIGYDTTGPHLFQTCPSGNVFEYNATAIGARSQSARTYLEKHFETLEGLDLDAMIQHAVNALQGTSADKELTCLNTAVAVVGEGTPFQIIDGEDIRRYIDALGAGAEAKQEAKDDDDEMAD